MTDQATNHSVPPVRPVRELVSLLVWDDDTEPPIWDGAIVLWRSYRRTQDESVFSLPELVDKQAEELRRKFLAFVYQIGETRISGKSIIDHLELRTGLSYWWMTLIAQKDVYANSPYIYDVLKLFAFEGLARSYNCSPVRLCSRKQELALVLCAWCQDEGRHFEWSRPDRKDNDKALLSNVYKALPPLMRALLSFLKFISIRLSPMGSVQNSRRLLRSDIAIFDVFTHLHAHSLLVGIFASGYWSNLVTLFNDSKTPVNWLHWYYKHPAVPNLHTAITLASDFSKAPDNQYHQIIDSRISLRLAAKVITDFIRLNRAELSITGVEQVFRPKNSKLNFWELFKGDWIDSFRSPKAVISLFHLNILEERIKSAPRQKLGIYVQENQPWEIALVHLWRTYGHGLIVGVAHTTIPFWDLRYAFDPRTFENKNNGLPIPDFVALNGPNAISNFEKSGYPTGRYREVEALRYLYLRDLRRNVAQEVSNESRALRVLVLGDLIPEYTNRQISFLEYCADIPGVKLDLVFKPHPASANVYRKIGLPNLRISTRHISDELSACDVVFVGSATSAAADAYQIGVPVISVNDGNRINFSPVYGTPGVEFVHSPNDLARALSNIDINQKRQHAAFFTLDENLPRWKSLIFDALYSK